MADKIITHPATPEYRSGWDRIFGGGGQRQRQTFQQIAAEVYFRVVDGKIDAPGRPVHGLPAEAPGRGAFGQEGT